MNAVIYARYSSENQREESIEGQIRECTEYAERKGYTVLRSYVDRAISGRTDRRPAFREMIADSKKRAFDVIIVWKLDRFSRSRYDSSIYKRELQNYGIKVVSATEGISDSPEGIILESMIEGYGEYYSVELGVKVRRGQKENALKCKCNGGIKALGYRTTEDGYYEIDPNTAPIVREIFTRYDSGETIRQIVESLNARGLKNQVGDFFKTSAVGKLIKNRKYIGEYRYGDIVTPDGVPAIIDKNLFDRVQQRVEHNKKKPASAKAKEEYLLTSKLFCGNCGRLMVAESGRARNGTVYRYYKCGGSKRHLGCHTKGIKKDAIEKLVVKMTAERVLQDEEINRIADAIVKIQAEESPMLPTLKAELKECERKIDNIVDAIAEGIHTSTTKAKLEALEDEREKLQISISQAQLEHQCPIFTKDEIVHWISQFKGGDINDPNYQKQIIDVFVNAVYVYGDRLVFTYNYKDGSDTILRKEIDSALSVDGSDTTNNAPPKSVLKSTDFSYF